MQAQATAVRYTHLVPYGHHPISGRRGPYLPVRLINPTSGKAVDTLAIIDSGAAFSLFRGDHALALELVVRNGRRTTFFPAAAPFEHEAFLHQIRIEINGFTFDCEVAFTEHGLARDALGREGFFNRVQIGFREQLQEIYLILHP